MRLLLCLTCLWLGVLLSSCGSSERQYFVCDACGTADGSRASCSTFDAVTAASAKTACEQFFGGKLCSCRPGIALSGDACGLCTGQGGGDASDWSCAWHADSTSRAPHAAYDCEGGVLYRCQLGTWEQVVDCGTMVDVRSNTCGCVGGLNYNQTSCMSSLDVCGTYTYDTCGPNGTPVVVDGVWSCQ
jgi:hypothetical protein